MDFHVRRRYGMPPTDPRYLDMTIEQIVVDYWAHAVTDNPKLRNEIENPDFEADMAELEAEIEAELAAAGEAPAPDAPEAVAAAAQAEAVAAELGDEWEVDERRWS